MLQRRARRLQAAFHHLAKRCSLQDSKSRPVRIIKGQKSGRSTRLSKSPSTKKANFPGMLHSIATFFNVHTSHSMICTILLGEGIIKKKLGWGRPPVPQPNHPHPIPLELVSICIKIKRPKSLVTLASQVPSRSIWSDWSPWSVRWPCQSDQSRKPDYFSHPSQSGHLTRTGSGKSVIMISVSKTFWLSVLVSFFHFPNNGRGMWRRNVQLNYATFLCEPAQTSTSRIKFSWFWMNS